MFEQYGPFFAVEQHTAPPPPPWRPLAELAAAPELVDRLDRVSRALGSDRRTAGSIAQQGVVARLLAPVLASVTLGRLPELTGGYWQPPLDSTFALSLPVAGPLTDEGVRAAVSQGPVAAVSARLGELAAVSTRVLLGNVASAVNGAALQLGPASYPAAARLVAVVPGEDGRPGPAFRRRSCCLLYRVGGRCGDCVLRTATGR